MSFIARGANFFTVVNIFLGSGESVDEWLRLAVCFNLGNVNFTSSVSAAEVKILCTL